MKTLLLIEDDAVFKTILARLLDGHVNLVHAPNTGTALAQLDKVRPDVVVLDGLLPDGDGIGFMTANQSKLAGIPIVFASAFWRDIQSFKKLKALGVHSILHKPVNPRELLRTLDTILGTTLATPAAAESNAPVLVAR